MVRIFLHRSLLACLLLMFSQVLYAEQRPEQRLLQALNHIQVAERGAAEKILENLIQDEPEFKLANMLYADLLKSRSYGLQQAGMGLLEDEQLHQLLVEVKKRWQAQQLDEQFNQKIPAGLTRLDGRYVNAIAVDLKQSRLFVFENHQGYPKQVADYFVSMGRAGPRKEKQGDLRTPLGVYFVQSHIPAQKLADKYGSGAYPINYPNAWDSFQGRTGNGIWLHGTRSGTYNRPPLASEGCVVLPNDDLLEVGSYISLGQTPVIIGYDLQWLPLDQWQEQKQQVSKIFEQWVTDWQSLNTENYLSHYSKEFSNGKKDFENWVAHKRRVAQYKKFVNVETEDLSLLMHPNEDVLVATFYQKYESDNYRSQTWKRQYWHKEEDGQWRIIFEGEIPAPAMPQLARRSL